MKKENKKTIKKRTLITTISLVLTTVFIAVLLALFITNSIKPNNGLNSAFIDYRTYYDGNQVPIASTNDKESTTEVTMTYANGHQNDTSLSEKTITISTAEELYLFSQACFNNSAFLAYDYKLLCNINYDDTVNKFIPIGWNKNVPYQNQFSGTFDGQGYDIKNLEMVIINSSNYTSYNSMEYFAMFSKIASGAEVKNFGLIEPTVTLAYLVANMANNGVANVAGLNAGTISGVYVKSLETELIDECGITAAGGYRISGFVLKNTGTISDCYYATNSVYNYTLTDVVEFADIVLDTGGTVTGTYFIDYSIKSFTTSGSSTTITYYSALGAKTKTLSSYAGTYVEDEAELCNAFSSNTNWSIKGNTKADYKFYYTYTTPVRRKFTNNPTIVSTGTDDDGDTVITALSINITNVNDFLYAYELMNNNSFFASDKITYNITSDINLSNIPASAYVYARGIGATFKGNSFENGTVKLVNGDTNSYPTIYNADIFNSARKVSTTGLDTYGLFPYLTGKVEDLNVVVKDQNLDNIAESTNAKAIGGIAGYIELGEVNNVNVYMKLSNTTSSKLGEYYLGGICGVLGGEGKVKNSTVTGEFDIKADSSYTTASGYMQGVAVGGAIGYIEDSVGDVETLLNAVDIKTNLGSSTTYAIGGVIGAGYTREAKYLENMATVSVGSSDVTPTYTKLYVAGIIGRHLGETGETSAQAEVNNFTNQGNVSVYGNSSATLTMVAGIENADIQTLTTTDARVTPSKFVDKANNILFYASAMTNRANITINGATNTNTLHSCGINVCTGNGFKSVISSIYNLDNNKIYQTLNEGTDEETLDTSRSTKTIGTAQTVDMSVTSNYAGLVNVYNKNTKTNTANTSSLNSLHLVSAYNLRDIEFTMSSAIPADSIYSAVANGSFIDYDDIRNEGNMSFALSQGSSTKRNLYINGAFDEISLGNYAKNIYNGGNITITDSAEADVKVDIYVSGICRNNKAVISDLNQKPIESTFDSSLVGSLDNVINNGNILVTSSDYNFEQTATYTNNNNQPANVTQTTDTNLVGNIYAAGITCINSGIISNTYNLGDVQLDVFSKATAKYYAAGIVCIMSGEHAQIRDSANNGKIQVINMANEHASSILVGGIFATNIETSNANRLNIKQIVSFTINYGTLIGFTGYANKADANITTLYSFVGGISAKGLCNIVNVLNYGNIYGSEAVGSMIGAFDLSNYDSEVTVNDVVSEVKVNLANTINYSPVKALVRSTSSGATLYHANFNDVKNLTYIDSGGYNADRAEYYYLGSMFGFINYNSQKNINVRYVINFFNGANITQSVNQKNAPTGNDKIDTSTFITVNGSSDTFGGGSVKFAPLKAVEDEDGNIGVFSKKFIFRRAINGDPEVVDSSIVTDAYIADFFQFVRFDKVNEVLLEKIGWKNIAYLSAAEELAKDVKTMAVFVNDSHAGLAKTTVEPSFTSNTWYENIDETLLLNFLNEALSNNNGNTTDFSSSDLKAILEYILFDNSCISSITTSIRSSIINTIISYYDKLQINYSDLLQTLLYDELLAKVVSGEDVNYTAVQNKIKEIINAQSSTVQKKILDNYLELLLNDTDNDILTPLFETVNSEGEDYYLAKKLELITTLLSGYSTETLDVIAGEILTGSSTSSADKSKLEYINYLRANESEALDIYANIIAANSFSGNSDFLAIINESLSKYDSVAALGETSFESNIIDDFEDFTYNQYFWAYPKDANGNYESDENVPDALKKYKVTNSYSWINGTKWDISKDYTDLWNIVIKDSDVQNYISTRYFAEHTDPTSSIKYNSIIAKATEWNNTYQSNDGPSEITENDVTSGGISLKAGDNLNSNNHGSYNINNGGIYRNNYNNATGNPYQVYLDGDTTKSITGKNQIIKNRFIYTPDIVNSYATNYYGPYMANGKVFNEAWKQQFSFKGMKLYDVAAQSVKQYAPIFISTQEEITQNALKNSNTDVDDSKKIISPFYWNNMTEEGSNSVKFSKGAHYEWVSDYILDTEPKDAANYLYKNYKTGEYIVGYYDFDPNKSITWTSDMNEANTTINYEGHDIVLNLSAKPEHGKSEPWTTWNSDNPNANTYPLREHYLKGYATSCIITGIWFVHSVYASGSKVVGTYLCSKEGGGKDSPDATKFNKYQGIQTTQYTYYQMADLVKLDGERTKGTSKGKGIVDFDEKAIISSIMTKMLKDDTPVNGKTGKETVLRALANYGKDNEFTSEEANSVKFIASALIGTSFAKNAVTNVISQQTPTALTNEIYSKTYDEDTETYITVTLKDRLDYLVANYTFSSIDELSIDGATNKEVFKKILLLTLHNKTENYDNDVGTNKHAKTAANESYYKDITYYIYKFAEALRAKDPDITDAQIATYLSQISSSDLTAFTNLSYLDWDNHFITVIGGDADANQQDGIGSYTDIKALYESLGSTDGADIAKGYAYPFKIADDTLISPSASKINMTLSAGTKQVDACYTYEASSTGNNIGYYVGSDIKVYNKNKANFNTFYYPNGDGDPYTLPTAEHAAPSQDIVEYLSDTQTDGNTSYRNGDYLIRLTGSSQLDANNEGGLVAVENAYVGTWHGTLLVPNRCIWVAPVKAGTFKFVLSNIENNEKMGFRLYKLTRSTPGNYSTYFSNSTTAIECNKQLQAGKSYYYEIAITDEDIEAGYEYAIATGDGYKPYITYIDIGASGTDNTKVKYPDLTPIETNYNKYYSVSGDSTLTKYGNYLASNMINTYPTNTTSITVSEPTILLVKATNGGKITINGKTTYLDDESVTTSISSVSKNTNGTYRAFYLSGPTGNEDPAIESITYTITATDTTITDIIMVEKDNSITYNPNDNTANTITYTNGSESKIIFKGTNYTNLSSFNLNIDLTNEMKETLYVVYPSMITGTDPNKEYYFFNDATKGDSDVVNIFTPTDKKDIIILLANADYQSSTSVLGKLITNLNSSYYDDLLLSITDDTVRLNIVDKIIAIANTNSTTYANTEDLIIAAYLGQDYLNNSLTTTKHLKQTKLNTLLSSYASPIGSSTTTGDTTAGFYQFIEGDSKIDATKFEAFLKHLGVTSDLNGYGIFALASSHGIKNGAFIPDNIDLLSMDDPYDKTATDDYNNKIIKLNVSYKNSSNQTVAEIISPSWRDNRGDSSITGYQGTIYYNTNVTTSVNYAFRIEMKQLKLAISTTIFELDLDDTSDALDEIFATSSTIDVDNGTITYYVPTSYVDTLKAKTAMPISYIKYAETATYKTNNNNTTTINLTGGTVKDGAYEVYSAITVTAEDTTVINNYTIRIIGIDLDFTIVSFDVVDITEDNGDDEISYNGGTVTLTISTTNIPNSFDFKSFFSIVNGTTTYKATDTNPGFVFNSATRNNGIVNANAATLVIDVLSSLPGGEEEFTIKAFNITRTQEISKAKNSENYITKLEFEGKTLTATNGNYTSEIKFGRAYDYTELTDYESEDFYLSGFEISDNATVESITAIKPKISESGYRINYIVTFVIKSETGVTATYTHTLSEMEYFKNNTAYATLYKDGVSLAESDLYKKENFIYNGTPMSKDYVSLTFKSNTTRYAAAMFNRGDTPEYRIKYILTNFYTLGDDITYHITDATLNNGTSVSESYLGLTATFSEDNEPGTFKYEYVYESKGVWIDDHGNNEEYTRQYTFPALYIILGYSRDALLHRLTFLDQSIIIGNTASVMKTNTTNSTSILADNTTTAVDGHEAIYNNIFKESSRDIEIKGKTIKYSSNTDATSISDYYAIGTVANADLSNYSPTFGLEEHGNIFQYTTIEKLQYYGSGKQDAENNEKSDAEILTNHDTLLLYIPFVKNNETEVLLVELQYNSSKKNYIWKNVYDRFYDGTSTGSASSSFIGAYTNSKSTLEMMTTPSLASIAGYTLSDECGKLTSSALYMDYIGTPLENHFWYVSYVVFSEAALHGEFDEGNMRYYHISIVDAVNTIYFEVKLYAPADFAAIEKNQTLYMTISENIYNDNVKTSTRQISGYLVAQTDENGDFITGTSSHNNGLVLYKLRFNLQTLPRGYFYFSVDLPNGYVVTAKTDMKNQFYKSYKAVEEGSFLPYTSIITKTVQLEYIVRAGDNEAAKAWAVAISDIYTRKATYIDGYKTVAIDATLNISSIIPSDSTGTSTWESSNEDILTVNSNGLVTGKSAGTAIVTVTKGDNKFKVLVYVE